MNYLRAGDTLSGEQGKAIANIGGRIEDLFYLKDMEATLEKLKAEVRVLGRRATQHKGNGWTGTGTMTLYYVTSVFRSMVHEYAKTGKDHYFTLTVVNEDPTSTVGRQTIVLYGCNVDSLVLTKLDVEAEALDEEISFTFDDFDILDEFGQPIPTA